MHSRFASFHSTERCFGILVELNPPPKGHTGTHAKIAGNWVIGFHVLSSTITDNLNSLVKCLLVFLICISMDAHCLNDRLPDWVHYIGRAEGHGYTGPQVVEEVDPRPFSVFS
jgi:hypothetical protein